MCRSIKPLFNFEPPATEQEVHEAALQFVRKISGFTRPSEANRLPFDLAVEEVGAAAHRLIAALQTRSPPRDRAVEAERRRAKVAQRAL